MNLRTMLRGLAVGSVTLAASVVLGQPAHADDGGLDVTVQAGHPVPVVVLTNHGRSPCQVSTMSIGTISLTGVQQNGRAIEPVAITPSFDDDLGYTMGQHLTTLTPGQTARLPLDVVAAGPTGSALRTVSFSAAVIIGSLYPIDAGHPVEVRAAYSPPDITVSGAPLCVPGSDSASGTAATGTSFPAGASTSSAATGRAAAAPGPADSGGMSWKRWAVIAAVSLVLLAVAVLLLTRRARRRRIGAGALGVILLAAAAAVAAPPPRAAATVTGAGSAAGAVAACVAGFNAPGGDPAGIMGTLNNPAVHVSVNLDTSGSNGENRLDPNNIFIYWNPTDTSELSGHVARVPCDELYHEMYHAFEDTTPQGVDVHECFDQAGNPTGIAIKEVHATDAENKLRASKNEPLRKQYGPNTLPPGGCRPPKPSDPLCHPTRGCPTPPAKQGQTTADPHVTSFDGRRFDFQAAGEFVVTRDTAADPATAFQIQVRAQPWPGSRLVGVNTAMAANVAGDRVEVTVANGQMAVLVNGSPHPLTGGSLPRGGDLIYTPRAAGPFLTIDWPDGSYVLVTLFSRTLTLIVVPSAAHYGRLTGLLGDADGNPSNDLPAAAGSSAPSYDVLYPGFADSLRIKQAESLFTYSTGTSTTTYTDRTFPDRSAAPSSRSAWARAVCTANGITDPVTLENCVLDLANTGNPGLLAASQLTQAVATSFRMDGSGTTVAITPSGSRTTVPFTGRAGQKLYVDVVASTLPSACGQLSLQDSTGKSLATGCIINGTGGIDAVTLPADGAYQVVVAPPAGVTGTVTMRLVSASDQRGVLTIDGPPVAVGVTAAGGVGRLTFAGTKGDVVYVNIPTATLSSACGVIAIHDPNDDVLASGCVIDGQGSIDRTTLPATGTYAFVLDPAGAATGGVQVRLTRAVDQVGTIQVDGPAVAATVSQPGAVARLSFAASAGEKVFVRADSATVPGQCGDLSLRGPSGNVLDTGCVLDGKGQVDATLLPDDGTYSVVLDPADAGIGAVRLRVIRDIDQQGTIALGGPPVTASVAQPGAISRFTFQGTAGQKVAVIASGSTLPADCGQLRLLDASGAVVTTGCLVGGASGIDPVALPATGTFTVVLDPGDAATGQVQLALTAAS
ncbi:von Willebrand factor type D domain-containing protein [Nakamurella panacisegetis]|uniref:von Willebrand factor type D domain-containing protein n=1 Tax=Nakamurella panacisegetis TaxID=1090615 RepID=A0A1H0IQM0_9ACTN|nr:VWD domain-containing protein [Nakamurella panacisegetis]SDO33592.1 von Willebrand factor type D domain-containing protein [Nakamurella panacisegetis]